MANRATSDLSPPQPNRSGGLFSCPRHRKCPHASSTSDRLVHRTSAACGSPPNSRASDRFTVIYFLQVKKDLTYSDACTELGICIMHALACDSKIDNRTKAEARNDQG